MDDIIIYSYIYKKARPESLAFLSTQELFSDFLQSIQEYEQVVKCKTFRCHTMKQL